MPGLRVIRPADANESAQALRLAIDMDGPTALILSRQNLPVLEGTAEFADRVERGAYVLHDPDPEPDVVLIGTGSEVGVCMEAAKELSNRGYTARVVSMPSWDLFEEQDEDYQDDVLGPGSPVLSVEAASSFGWSRWADDSVAIDRFGASGKGADVLAFFGFTADNVADRAISLILSLEGSDAEDLYDTFGEDEEDFSP
jgi:transketolase